MLSPKEIVAELDKYIVGQEQAKKYVAIALRNRWRRMHVSGEMQREIMPNNILMIGPTGVGKTEIARRLAKLADAPFVKVEASKFTEVGYVGRDVEGMVRDLVEQAVRMVKHKRKEAVEDLAKTLAEEEILDILIPPLAHTASGNDPWPSKSGTFDREEATLNEKTREKFREKLRRGELDERKIEIQLEQSVTPSIGFVGPAGIEDQTMQGIQEMISGLLPKKTTKRKVSIAEARKLLIEEKAAKLVDLDMDEIKAEAVRNAQDNGIIFIDEIDKIAKPNAKSHGPDVSREGVQRDLLPIVEGSAVQTKYGVVHTDHILFIAAGAFHLAKPSDLIPELQGRFPIRVELQSLTKEDFVTILKTPQNALTKQYEALFAAEGVRIIFQDQAIDAIADVAYRINGQIENIGARRLHTVMSTLLNDYLYEIPDVMPADNTIIITEAMVYEKLNTLVQDIDLSRYIL